MRRVTRRRATIVVLVALLALAGPATSTATPVAPAGHGGWHARWNDDTQPGAQDVYVFLDGTLRNPDGDTPGDEPLWNVGGVPLGMTWGDYRDASARSLAVVAPGQAPRTTLIVGLDGLVPHGVYSLFYTTFTPDSDNPHCPGVLRELPVTILAGSGPRPDASSFVADHRGRATLVAVADEDLLAVGQSSLQVIYHADGQTYHPLPNRGAFETQGDDCRSSYGVDAMRQVFILQNWTF